MRYYGEHVLRTMGEKQFKSLAGDKYDTLQMGGNVTVDCTTKKMTMVYKSKSPIDRPSADEILS